MPGDWLYMTFVHQACVYETKEQYNTSHQMVTDLVNDLYRDGMIHENMKDAISSFQIKLHNKQKYELVCSEQNVRVHIMSFNSTNLYCHDKSTNS